MKNDAFSWPAPRRPSQWPRLRDVTAGRAVIQTVLTNVQTNGGRSWRGHTD